MWFWRPSSLVSSCFHCLSILQLHPFCFSMLSSLLFNFSHASPNISHCGCFSFKLCLYFSCIFTICCQNHCMVIFRKHCYLLIHTGLGFRMELHQHTMLMERHDRLFWWEGWSNEIATWYSVKCSTQERDPGKYVNDELLHIFLCYLRLISNWSRFMGCVGAEKYKHFLEILYIPLSVWAVVNKKIRALKDIQLLT